MEDIIVEYVKSLPKRKIDKHKLYFKCLYNGYETGVVITKEMCLSPKDKTTLALKLYGKLIETLDFEKIVDELEK